jgi:hypothetical protein
MIIGNVVVIPLWAFGVMSAMLITVSAVLAVYIVRK